MEEITITIKETGVTLQAYDHDQYAEIFISRNPEDDEEQSSSFLLDKKTGIIEIGEKKITPMMWKMIKDLMDQNPDSL